MTKSKMINHPSAEIDEEHQQRLLDLKSSKRASNYRKICHLGEGQYANVYMASQEGSNLNVAIKKIKLGNRFEFENGINR